MNEHDKMTILLKYKFGKSRSGDGFVCPCCHHDNGGIGLKYKHIHDGYHCYECGLTASGADLLFKYSA